MQPIFHEYIKFLNSQGCNTDWFQERTFWLDRNMVKGFKRGGARTYSAVQNQGWR